MEQERFVGWHLIPPIDISLQDPKGYARFVGQSFQRDQVLSFNQKGRET
jgi:hypothetical protein